MIYDKVKKICAEKGCSISMLEKQAGLGHGTIPKWNKSSPTVATLAAVAKVLDTTVSELLKE